MASRGRHGQYNKMKSRPIGHAVNRHRLKMASGTGRGGHLLPMTTFELCRFDDICSGMIVDPMLGFKTHKMNIRFRPLRQQKELKSIVEDFQKNSSYDLAIERLLDVDQRRVAPLVKTPRLMSLMRQHMEHFLRAFDKDSGFAIQACSRYSQEGNQGGKIVATRAWQKGEKIEKLAGCIGELTAEQERELLVHDQNDFSVMWSSRKRCSQLWLGPAAYMNHDCEPNCRFNVFGNNVTYTAIRPIATGDELFLSYGDSFFGENNCNCQCGTCEQLSQGFFRGQGKEETDDDESLFERPADTSNHIKTRRRARALNGLHSARGRRKCLQTSQRADMLKGSKMTRYDREIIGVPVLLPARDISPSMSACQSGCSEGGDGCPNIQRENACRVGASRLGAGGLSYRLSKTGSPRKRNSQGRFMSGVTPSKLPRLECQRSCTMECRGEVDENLPLHIKEEPLSDCESVSSWVNKYIGSPKLEVNHASPNVRNSPSLALRRNSHHHNLHRSPQPNSLHRSPQPNGLSPLGRLKAERSDVRHSPRLKIPHPPLLIGKAGGVLGVITSERGSDNSDSGLGGMATFKPLDSNHNVHDTPSPPVLEPEVPYDRAHPPPPVLQPQGQEVRERRSSRSSSSVPRLPYFGPTEDSRPVKVTIKLHHPDKQSRRVR